MIRVLIADSDMICREKLRAALACDPEIEVVGQARDGREAMRLAHALRPDVVLMAADLSGQDGFRTAEMLAASGLTLEIIVLSESVTADDLRRAMRTGARELLNVAISPDELCAAVQTVYAEGRRRRSADFAAEADPQNAVRVIAVSGAKGGIGKTTLAVNLASALAVQTGEPTVLLDLYTQFGDAALLLNLFPRRTLAELVPIPLADLDERLLEDHLEGHACGLRLLAGAGAPLPIDALSPVCLDQILRLLGRSQRFVVLDVPPLLSAATRHALSHASVVLLVANLFDLTTLADTRLWLEAMTREYVARETVQIVLNRVSARNRLEIPDIERTLGYSASALIPNDGKLVPSSINAGVPFVLSHPSSRIAQSVFALAQTLSAPPNTIEARPVQSAPAPRQRLPFLSPLMRRGE